VKHSLLLRFGIVVTILFILAVSGMVSSMMIADTAEGYAAAINQAGTLRMQSYRIASSLVHGKTSSSSHTSPESDQLVEEYNQRLHSPRIHDVLAKGTSWRVSESYQKVESLWQEVMLPNLNDYLTLTTDQKNTVSATERIDASRRSYLNQVDEFVDDIHRFVEALEVEAEQKNQQLRLIQITLLTLTFLVTLVSLYLTKISVLNPLRNLLSCAKAARHGDFSVRSRFLSEDELGQLGQAFNLMADNLSLIYSDLESRVEEKTRDLEQSNRTLELLYSTTNRLKDSPLNEQVLIAVIHDIEALIGVKSGTICLGQSGNKQAYRYASTRENDILLQEPMENPCALCFGKGDSHCFQICDSETQKQITFFSTPVHDKTQHYGVLMVELPATEVLEEWQALLLETVASQIALTITAAQQDRQNRKMSLMEERSIIARELHDSIAQSLSYLKIQVSRLEKAIHEDLNKEDVLLISSILRSALNGTYRQLRELLTTFRLKVTDANLGKVLRETVEEYSNRSGIPIVFNNEMGNCQLAPNAEIHIIQIIREALSNVVRHANATEAMVSLQCDQHGSVTVNVEDDGIGIDDDDSDMMHHYGLPIMKERAEHLGGSLHINESPIGGTQINLVFSIADLNNRESKPILAEQLKDA
jgi:two-component system nitrate/nitrite sensor histidine kinase NarX